MSPDFDDLVETSTSLGEAITEGDQLTLHSLSRSSNDSALPEVIGALDAAARLAGGELEVKHNYNGWRPDLDSLLSPSAKTVYERLFGEPPIVTAVHAGLETAVIGSKVPRPRHALLRAADRVSAFARRTCKDPDRGAVLEAARSGRRRAFGTAELEAMEGFKLIVGWILALFAGIALLLVVTALIGTGEDSGETVTAGEWAQSTCGAVGVWRGEMEDIVEELRTPSEFPASGAEEPQSETPQGRTGFVRVGLERAVQATDTMIEGIDNAGTPDTPEGAEAARLVSEWSDSALDDLEDAQDSLDEEADSIEESITQLTDAAARDRNCARQRRTDDRGRRARSTPSSRTRLQESSTCQQLREETS